MKKIIALFLALTFALMMVPALAEDGEITAVGSATVQVEADTAHVNLGVVSYGKDASEASQLNAKQMEQLKAALAENGVDEKDITTSYYYVSARRNYNEIPDEYGAYAIVGYEVNNTMSVTVRDMDKVGKIIDIALANGANSCDGIFFSATGAGEARDNALTGAIAEAKRKAELMAAACGGQLGDIEKVVESNSGYSVLVTNDRGTGAAAKGEEYETQITSDGVSFTATVTVTFELKTK